MFFGEDPNVARYDVQKYPIFEKLTRTQMEFFWVPEEIKLDKDHREFKEFKKNERHIFLENLKWQILADSINGRAPSIALLPYVSLPELEVCVQTWTFFENIHSRSYTHIIRNIVPDPGEIFDDIVISPEIKARAAAMAEQYDKFIEYAQYFKMFGVGTHEINGKKVKITTYELKKRLFLMLISIYALESIRFYTSFACSFSFTEQKPARMEGNTKIISLIARDENQHTVITKNIITNYQTKEMDEEMLEVMKDCEPMVYILFDNVVSQEKLWAEYLFQYGPILGLNAEILSAYIEYQANFRMKNLGYKAVYKTKVNPLPWMANYLNSKNKQVSPQEVELNAYKVGGIDTSYDPHKEFKDFKF